MNNKIRFALIGCGHISSKHFDAISHIHDAELVAVCDEIYEKAKEIGVKYRISYYSDYEKMLSRDDIDIVSICTPSGLHPAHGIAAAKRNYHILCEKPLATNIDSADYFIKFCEKQKVHLLMIYPLRLNPDIQCIKKAVNKNLFGDIYMSNVNLFWNRTQDYYDSASWRGTNDLDGGTLVNQAIHYIDLLLWLFGPVKKVHAITDTLGRNISIEDTASIVMQFECGTIANLNITVLSYPKNFESSLTVLGETGTVKLAGAAIDKIEKWEFAQQSIADDLRENTLSSLIYESGHRGYYQNAIEVLKNKNSPLVSGKETLNALKVISLIYK